MSPCGFSGLPSDMERATLLTPVYMTLQLPRRTALVSPQDWWALTPPSHPYRRTEARRRFFSSALLHPRGQLSVRKWDALCCPDFPPAHGAQAASRPTASWRQRYENLLIRPASAAAKSVGQSKMMLRGSLPVDPRFVVRRSTVRCPSIRRAWGIDSWSRDDV